MPSSPSLGPGYSDVSARYAQLQAQALQELQAVALVELRSIASQALKSTSQSAQSITAFADHVEENWRNIRQGLIGGFANIGRVMRETALSTLDQAQKYPSNPDRNGSPGNSRRYSGGLRKALNDPEFIQVGPNYVAMDVAPLNKEAIHWARMTYGAGGVGGYQGSVTTDGSAPIDFVGGVAQEAPRPGFLMPAGFWKNNQFYPTGKTPMFPTRGIQPMGFIQAAQAAGIRAFNRMANEALEKWGA